MAASGEDDRILISIIADEDTTVGFLLAGIGETIKEDNQKYTNFLIVREDDSITEVEKYFSKLYQSQHIGVILIGSDIWKYLQPIYNNYPKKKLPIVMEIDTKTSSSKPLKLRNIDLPVLRNSL